MKTLLRTAQTYLPWAPDAKYLLQRSVRRALRRPHDADFRALASMGMGARPVVLDVGANRGQSIDAVLLAYPGAAITAFEPNPRLARQLDRRYAGRRNVDVRSFGLGAVAGDFELHFPVYRGYAFDGLASLDRESARDWLNPDRIVRFDPRLLHVESVRCTVERLDDLDLAPTFVKVDVQGTELEVLTGGRETLRRHRPALLIEAPSAGVRELLGELAYAPYQWTGAVLEPEDEAATNTFFLPSA
jgi:FkbM family methyltransferase